MAGEFTLINPRRRRRRAKKAKASRPRRRRRARASNPNPLRRRRSFRRRRPSRRRAYRNPGRQRQLIPGLDLMNVTIMAGAVVGSDMATGMVARFLPPEWSAQPLARMGVKAAIGLGVPFFARRFIGARTANALMAGTAIGLILDAYHAFLAPAMGLQGYEPGTLGAIGDYEAGQLGMGQDDLMEPLGIGETTYEGGVYG